MPSKGHNSIRQQLEKRRDALVEDYQVASEKLEATIDPVERKRLARQLEILEKEIQEVESKLSQLSIESPPPEPALEHPDDHRGVSVAHKQNPQVLFIINSLNPLEAELAKDLYQTLKSKFAIIVDDHARLKRDWVQNIKSFVQCSDFIVPFFSESSVYSEVMHAFVQAVYNHSLLMSDDCSNVFPLRIRFSEPMPYPLCDYLAGAQEISWYSKQDTEQVIQRLQCFFLGEGQIAPSPIVTLPAVTLAEAIPHPLPHADMRKVANPERPPDSFALKDMEYYIPREGDDLLRAELDAPETTVVIQAPMQMGKSCLLGQGIEHAHTNSTGVAFLDLQTFGDFALKDPRKFYKLFLQKIAADLQQQDRVDERWQPEQDNVMQCTYYMQRNILKEISSPILLAIDNADLMLNSPICTDFFAMLRNWHNRRASGNGWEKFKLVMVISADPIMLIQSQKQSPFNVARKIELDDFTPGQVAELNQKYGEPFDEASLNRLIGLVGGHPYLVRKAMYFVAKNEWSTEDLLVQATSNRGPFWDHLSQRWTYLMQDSGLKQALGRLIHHGIRPSDEIAYRLKAAGFIRQVASNWVPRYQLYGEYFKGCLTNE